MHAPSQPMSGFPSLAAAALYRVTQAGRALFGGHQAASNGHAVGRDRQRAGHVSLVGSGPGDPELLTLKALRALQGADVILHDQLVSAEVLALASSRAERIHVGKKGYGAACKQSDINDLMVALASAGRRVVRLKAGDSLMFGRLDEETAALVGAGIDFEVVPGISAAQGAAAGLGLSLTRRRGARRFQAITGHAADGRLPDDFDWAGLADPKATTAVYMPKATIGALCGELLRRGLAAEQPAVAVFNATRADEVVVTASVGTLPECVAAVDNGAPCIILIGIDAANAASVARSAARECVNA